MRHGQPCDSALEALGWAMHTPTGDPGSRLTLMWIAQTMVGGSETECDGLVRVNVETIAEETQQRVEDVEAALAIFLSVGLLQVRWVRDDITSSEESSGNRYFLATNLRAEPEDFPAHADPARVDAGSADDSTDEGVVV